MGGGDPKAKAIIHGGELLGKRRNAGSYRRVMRQTQCMRSHFAQPLAECDTLILSIDGTIHVVLAVLKKFVSS